jgi:tetratricopeptide (TPR) repeat protein
MSSYGNARYCRTCGTRLTRGNQLDQCAPCQQQTFRLALEPPDVPDSFWDTRPMRDAAASWHIGQVIRAYRHHPHHAPRPLPQELIAGWLGLTQTQLSRTENGPPVKDLDKLTRWAQILKIPARHLWFRLPGSDPGAVSQDASTSETRLSATLAPAGASPFEPAWPGSQQPADDDSDAAAMRSFRAADLQVGGGHLYATVVSYLQTALAPRVFGAATGGPGIFAAASALTEMAGWMAHDAGRDKSAEQHFVRALDLAAVGSDAQLSAHILASMSHLALHQGRPGPAIQLARQGSEALGAGSASPGLAARLLAMEARGLAALPQSEPAACGKALLRAEQQLDQEPAATASPWISRFDEGSLASEAARCLRQLGQLSAAARQAERIIDIRPGSHTRSRAFAQLLLASVLIAQGEPEQACTIIQEVLDATKSLSSYQVSQQLRGLVALLEPYQTTPAVGVLLTSLHAALHQRLWLTSWLAPDGQPSITADRQQL